MEAELYALYREVVEFMLSHPGYYKEVDPEELCREIAEALHTGQYFVARNNGEIAAFAIYWKIDPEDLQLALNHGKPANTTTGSFLYVRDYAGDHPSGMRAYFRRVCADCTGVAWNREGSRVCYFPSQKGANHGRRRIEGGQIEGRERTGEDLG